LYVAFRPEGDKSGVGAFEFISGKVCHEGREPFDIKVPDRRASLEHCQALCAQDKECRAVSMTAGRCHFSTKFSYKAVCPEVFLKLRRDRFGRLISVKSGGSMVENFVGKSAPECAALCQAKQGCVNVEAPCKEDDVAPALTCDLMGERDVQFDDEENFFCDASLRNVWVHETRQVFSQEMAAVCLPESSRVLGEFAVGGREDCTEVCHALGEDCRFVSVAAAGGPTPAAFATPGRDDINCVALNAPESIAVADLLSETADGCAGTGAVVAGEFYPKMMPRPKTLDPAEAGLPLAAEGLEA
jgi:hypothetical protein